MEIVNVLLEAYIGAFYNIIYVLILLMGASVLICAIAFIELKDLELYEFRRYGYKHEDNSDLAKKEKRAVLEYNKQKKFYNKTIKIMSNIFLALAAIAILLPGKDTVSNMLKVNNGEVYVIKK